MTDRYRCRLSSPIGAIWMVVAGDALELLDFEDDAGGFGRTTTRRWPGGPPVERKDGSGIAAALDAYFRGDLSAIADLPARPAGTPFQETVWTALRSVPAGQTVSYGALARRIDRPRAARAVGAANGLNPVPVVVPCHRAIGADGSLVGYGGGLARKAWLLEHEGALPSGSRSGRRAR